MKMTTVSIKSDIVNPKQSEVLGFEQVQRLHTLMQDIFEVHGRGNFPTLRIKLISLIQAVRQNLLLDSVVVRDIRLNGGAASYVLGSNDEKFYSDVDLIFKINIDDSDDLHKVRNAVLNSMLNLLPNGVSNKKLSASNLNNAYVHKMVKICNDTDKWSLISLYNHKGQNVELKFVDTMKRQFEFSVDSFQIILDSLLNFYNISEQTMGEKFYPTVNAESMYGDFNEALHHLNKKLIATRTPEEIRGGGLLKYCHLLVRDYIPADHKNIKLMERYMCSRFFIDFSDIQSQRSKLENYLTNHFQGDSFTKRDYLGILYNVVNESTICLMGHERRQTLTLIQQLASHVLFENEYGPCNKPIVIDADNLFGACFDPQSNLIIDQVYYGPYYNAGEQYYSYMMTSCNDNQTLMASQYSCPLCMSGYPIPIESNENQLADCGQNIQVQCS